MAVLSCSLIGSAVSPWLQKQAAKEGIAVINLHIYRIGRGDLRTMILDGEEERILDHTERARPIFA